MGTEKSRLAELDPVLNTRTTNDGLSFMIVKMPFFPMSKLANPELPY